MPTHPPARPCCCFRTPPRRLGERRSTRRSSRPCVPASLALPGVCLRRSLRSQLPSPSEQFARLRKRSSGSALVDCCDRGDCERAVSILSKRFRWSVRRYCAKVNTTRFNARGLSAPRVRRSAVSAAGAWTWHCRRSRPRHPSVPRRGCLRSRSSRRPTRCIMKNSTRTVVSSFVPELGASRREQPSKTTFCRLARSPTVRRFEDEEHHMRVPSRRSSPSVAEEWRASSAPFPAWLCYV